MADLSSLMSLISELSPEQVEALAQAALSNGISTETLALDSTLENRGQAFSWIKTHGKANADADKYAPKDPSAPITANQAKAVLLVARNHNLVVSLAMTTDGNITIVCGQGNAPEQGKAKGSRSKAK